MNLRLDLKLDYQRPRKLELQVHNRAFGVEQLDDTETGGVIGPAKHDVETRGAGDFEVSIRLCV